MTNTTTTIAREPRKPVREKTNSQPMLGALKVLKRAAGATIEQVRKAAYPSDPKRTDLHARITLRDVNVFLGYGIKVVTGEDGVARYHALPPLGGEAPMFAANSGGGSSKPRRRSRKPRTAPKTAK